MKLEDNVTVGIFESVARDSFDNLLGVVVLDTKTGYFVSVKVAMGSCIKSTQVAEFFRILDKLGLTYNLEQWVVSESVKSSCDRSTIIDCMEINLWF